MSEATTYPEAALRDLGIYVHVPFCERVCPYCDFSVVAVGALDPAEERAYLDLVLAELALWQRELGPELAGRPLATIYLGGGTPSLLSPGSVHELLGALVKAWPGRPHEITLELNPGTLEVSRVPGFRAAGVTRLSVGVQSFQDAVLQSLGRAHAGEQARRGLEACLAAGFASISADLIFGAPRQTEAGLTQDVERLVDLGVPHVSAYALTLEPGTPFQRAHARGRLELPDEDTAVRMGRLVRGLLAGAGYRQYEISSFARPGHASRHNQRYWLRQDVLGLGVSAASLVGGRRTRNAPARAEWQAAIRAGRLPTVESEEIGIEQARRETLYLGFRRLEGVSRAAFQRCFGAPPERHFAAEIRELGELGLIVSEAGHLRLTERGILFADEVFLRFVGR